MSRLYQQNETTANYRRFPVYLVETPSGIVPSTGQTGSGQICRLGIDTPAWTNTSGALTEVGNGSYYFELHSSELDTLGEFKIRYKSASTLEFNMDGQVVAFDPYAATNMGLSSLPTASPAAVGGLPTVNASNYVAGVQGTLNTLDGLNVALSGRIDVARDTVLASGIEWKTAVGFSTLTQADILSDSTPFAGANINISLSSLSGVMETVKSDIVASGDAWTTATGFSTLTANQIWDSLRTNDLPGTYGESFNTIISGIAVSGTTIQMYTNLTEETNDHYNGRIIIWTSGVLKDQATDITDYNGADKSLIYTAVTEAPVSGVTFIIV